jgi:Uma2 family endonuclease
MEAVKPNKSVPSTRKSPIERYLDRESKSEKKHEFLNGKIRKMPGSSFHHNQITIQIASAILFELEIKNKPFRVLSSDQKIYIPQLHQILYPDALIVYEKPEFWNHRKDVLLNPILIVEILSPSTEAYDRTTKFMSYKHIPSFKEYVMVNQDKKGIETWFREEEHLWRETVYDEENTTLELKSVGISISMEKIYRNIEFTI